MKLISWPTEGLISKEPIKVGPRASCVVSALYISDYKLYDTIFCGKFREILKDKREETELQ